MRWPTPFFYARAARALRHELALSPPGPPGTMPILFVTDLHGRIGMNRVIGAAARALGTPLVLNAGDTTVHGTRPEGLFVWLLARALPPSCQLVACGGNHDSALTDRQARRAGTIVLCGRVEHVAGVRIVGDSDPRLTSLGRPAIVQGQDIATHAARLARTAQESAARGEPVAILLVHDPYAARPALASGAVPLALSGHLHRRIGPQVEGRGVTFTASSTGRDVRQETLAGPLRNDAELQVLYLDETRGLVTHYRFLTITPAAGATVGPILPLPSPEQPGDTA